MSLQPGFKSTRCMHCHTSALNCWRSYGKRYADMTGVWAANCRQVLPGLPLVVAGSVLCST